MFVAIGNQHKRFMHIDGRHFIYTDIFSVDNKNSAMAVIELFRYASYDMTIQTRHPHDRETLVHQQYFRIVDMESKFDEANQYRYYLKKFIKIAVDEGNAGLLHPEANVRTLTKVLIEVDKYAREDNLAINEYRKTL